MNSMRIVGLVIVAVGIVLLLFGLNAADSPVDQVSEAVTGRYTDTTMWYVIGGIAAIVGGGLLALFGPRRL